MREPDDAIFVDEGCLDCGQSRKIVRGDAFPCAWDSLSDGQRTFLRRSRVTPADWCASRLTAENAVKRETGSSQPYDLPKAIPIQSDLL